MTGNETESRQRCSYYAWHKSQQMLESAPLAPLIEFLRPPKYFHSSISEALLGFTKNRSDGLVK